MYTRYISVSNTKKIEKSLLRKLFTPNGVFAVGFLFSASPDSDDKILSPVAVTTAVTTVVEPRSITATVVTSPSGPATSPSVPVAQRKNYPKRENRKPPAHLVDSLGPALFSTPDIIRRVSTDKQLPPVSPNPITSSQSVISQSVIPLPTTAAQQQTTTTVISSSTMSPPNVPSQTVLVQTTASDSLQHKRKYLIFLNL